MEAPQVWRRSLGMWGCVVEGLGMRRCAGCDSDGEKLGRVRCRGERASVSEAVRFKRKRTGALPRHQQQPRLEQCSRRRSDGAVRRRARLRSPIDGGRVS